MKSQVAPECGLEFSDHLGEPWRWSWLASQLDHLAVFGFSLALYFFSFLSEEATVREGKANISILIHIFIFACLSI